MSDRVQDYIDGAEYDDQDAQMHRFSLIHSLIHAYNRSDVSSLNWVISKYFLEHLDILEDLNIYETAEDCFTSRSGIRRFAQSIGFENFSAMKEKSWELPLHREFFTNYADHDDYRNYLSSRVAEMFDDINARVSDEVLDELASNIHKAEQVVIVGSDFLAMSLREFQHSMLVLGKLVSIISDSEGDINVLHMLREDDLVITVSVSGNYAQAVQYELEDVRAKSILITQNNKASAIDVFDQTICMSSTAIGPHNPNTVYAEYGVRYLCDLLYNRYYCLFVKPNDTSEAH